jgi:glyoxylate/hydroxypyruvate reductase A
MNCLMHLRHVSAYREQQARHVWAGIPQPAARDVRVGIMGMGVLGKDAAEVLLRLGFRVSGWSRTRAVMHEVKSYAGAGELDDFLASTDILVVLLPLTPNTRHILDAGLFAKLARDGALGGPVLINAGRGGLQNEADLITALTDGTLKAASLDVFETEPLPANSPFWALPNVVLTPHSAADSTPEALVAGIVVNIERYEATGRLEDMVERARGY